jgi:hypothetical protein
LSDLNKAIKAGVAKSEMKSDIPPAASNALMSHPPNHRPRI